MARFDRGEDAHEREAPPTESDAHQRLERAERLRLVRVAIARLPRRQREVLLLRIDGDLPFAEIAGALGITEVNAKVNFHHAVQRLKSLLRPD
jgi:RNA polymerase sigma-70 factor (ECF subfamily)